MVMQALARDLRDEGDQLNNFLTQLTAPDWNRATPFKSWTPEDVVVHLMVGDHLNTLSLTDTARFTHIMERRATARAAGNKTSGAEYLDEALATGRDLLAQWHQGLNQLCDIFDSADAKTRMKWVGPDMSVRSAATARLMETWAHGQDIYDMLGATREAQDRLKHIAVLGVNTFGWTFVNRGLETPTAPPFVQLAAPSGAIWTWNTENDDSKIVGPALDFCQVVTQGRNIDDVRLEVTGKTATQWMAIAQCFAGPAEDPPAPGQRVGAK